MARRRKSSGKKMLKSVGVPALLFLLGVIFSDHIKPVLVKIPGIGPMIQKA
jgi:hypothetical protein